ncbi:unnamed protein product, partial [Choristocarpus tenellus]
MGEQQRVVRCKQFMSNGGFTALAILLEKQAAHLAKQAKDRAAEKVALDKAGSGSRAGTSGGVGGPGGVGQGGQRELNGSGSGAGAGASGVSGERWLGAEKIYILLSGLVEAVAGELNVRVKAVAMRVCTAVMEQIKVLTEEELKKENQEQSLGGVVSSLKKLLFPMGRDKAWEHFRFHEALVLRHLRASSLPMRLWGWEQMQDVIQSSHHDRWPAKAYLVSPYYIADPERPGTDKDVDYYQHRSTADEDYM